MYSIKLCCLRLRSLIVSLLHTNPLRVFLVPSLYFFRLHLSIFPALTPALWGAFPRSQLHHSEGKEERGRSRGREDEWADTGGRGEVDERQKEAIAGERRRKSVCGAAAAEGALGIAEAAKEKVIRVRAEQHREETGTERMKHVVGFVGFGG